MNTLDTIPGNNLGKITTTPNFHDKIKTQLLLNENKTAENAAREDAQKQIEGIRNKLNENVNIPRQEEIRLPKEVVNINGKNVEIHYVPKEKLAPALGYYYGNGYIEVRDDLSPRVKQFVRAHELYHHSDTSEWGGWIGREVRANLFPGLKDPLGLLATIYMTLSSKERMDFYKNRIKRKY